MSVPSPKSEPVFAKGVHVAKDKLSDKFCRNAPKGKHSDGEGLYLLVDEKGRKYWRQKYTRPTDRKEDTLAHGVYPDTTLAEARDKRDAAKKLIRARIDPKAQRRADEATTSKAAPDAGDDAEAELFATVAEAYYEKKHRPWSATHRRDVRRMIDNEMIPALGAASIRAISGADVQKMLDRITDRGALTFARDVRMYFRAIWNYYNAKLAIEGGAELPDPSTRVDLPDAKKEQHHPALEPQEIGAFLRKLEFSDASAVTRIATKMLLLTAVRTTELREATWDEFDSKAAVWRIPPERMKADRGHIIPLSKQALALLAALRPHTGNTAYLFPNGRDDERPMSDNAILAALKRMGYKGKLTGHGMRSMFSTWAHEAGYSSDAIERQLAHAPADKVKAAYLRSEFLPIRTTMMQAWADWLDASAATADVIPLKQVS